MEPAVGTFGEMDFIFVDSLPSFERNLPIIFVCIHEWCSRCTQFSWTTPYIVSARSFAICPREALPSPRNQPRYHLLGEDARAPALLSLPLMQINFIPRGEVFAEHWRHIRHAL